MSIDVLGEIEGKVKDQDLITSDCKSAANSLGSRLGDLGSIRDDYRRLRDKLPEGVHIGDLDSIKRAISDIAN